VNKLEREFLERLAAFARGASIEEMNEGLCPHWQESAALSLTTGAEPLVCEAGTDPKGRTRYAVTDAGRAALAAPVTRAVSGAGARPSANGKRRVG